jgi:putative transposase
MTAYPSALTDHEWKMIVKEVPKAKKGGRKRSVNVREILNAIFYVLDNGIKWRSLPHDYPAWETVYGYFRRWSTDGTLERIHRRLRKITRVIAGKKPEETVGIIDSQSTKTTEEAQTKGFDAGKKNKGKKATLDR